MAGSAERLSILLRKEALLHFIALATLLGSLSPEQLSKAVAYSWPHALWLDPSGIRVETVNGLRGQRPWVPQKRRR